ncbi:unnamed protein product [Vitrella brassicaformis CCMP3155]|uniref:Uncharacterized protein n=1 Tax=Vitrella brassicaformis (strain CCMP3155) TaxID=1169540 RepID=A0A0G4EJH8_VITBC|nr:unnamed protein product [Vitrella brassicaformis CCMP3155]|eukprot:CEL96905.1 unnamed protein product [Vitrella brassicaformis CCMP3155]
MCRLSYPFMPARAWRRSSSDSPSGTNASRLEHHVGRVISRAAIAAPDHPQIQTAARTRVQPREFLPAGQGHEWTVTDEDARGSGGRLKVEDVPYIRSASSYAAVIYDKDWPLMSATSSAGQQPHQQQQQRPQQQAMKVKGIVIHLPPDTNDATQRLVQGIILRTITPAEVQQLIRQGADAAVYVELRRRRIVGRTRVLRLCLLSLAIDDWSTPTVLEEELTIGQHEEGEFILPLWPSREVQAAILSALIDAIIRLRIDSFPPFPGPSSIESNGVIEVAVRAGNLTAVKTLVANGAALRGRQLVFLPRRVRTSERYEAALMAIYTYNVKQDRSLATETDARGCNVIHSAAGVGPIYSEAFIHAFLQLMKDNGASLTHTTQPLTPFLPSATPLHRAAVYGSYHVIEWLCPHLSHADINERNSDNETPLTLASGELATLVSDHHPSARRDATISGMRGAIRAMLRSGAAIYMVRTPQQLPPNAEQSDREAHGVVLAEYRTVLNNELPQAVMDGVNGALNPQRDVADLLTRLLPLARFPPPRPKPSDATDNDAPAAPSRPSPFAHKAVDQMRLTTHTPLGGRVKAAMQHFVKCAATKTAGNREVVGVMANVGGRVVRVPLQCFAVNRGQLTHRRLGLREVVHKARLDEAARYGLTGIVKGFNTHLGIEDCQFEWQQLGWVDERGRFQPLGIN